MMQGLPYGRVSYPLPFSKSLFIMISPPLPANEHIRVSTLRSLALLDTAPEERFDRVTRIAGRVFDVPIALVSLIDSDRQWFKSCIGVDVSETPRDISFCGHAILGEEIPLVPDAKQDVRFADNPLVTGGPGIAFTPAIL
ncbi:GAF domain-containing protein [Noviherbaspirillum sp. Root189]|uniref:GAF domain-containing protein n=1 Tax=Noviherbaspirillum sp. Root189 TaxID=1736487 RepID=UPI000A4D264A